MTVKVRIRDKTHLFVTDNDSQTTDTSVSCCEDPPVIEFCAVQTYRPLESVEEICKLSAPVLDWLEETASLLCCHVNVAGGRDCEVQVIWYAWPTTTSPPPTQPAESLVNVGVSGPSTCTDRGYLDYFDVIGYVHVLVFYIFLHYMLWHIHTFWSTVHCH